MPFVLRNICGGYSSTDATRVRYRSNTSVRLSDCEYFGFLILYQDVSRVSPRQAPSFRFATIPSHVDRIVCRENPGNYVFFR